MRKVNTMKIFAQKKSVVETSVSFFNSNATSRIPRFNPFNLSFITGLRIHGDIQILNWYFK
jgi:hypothetical protein